jgi:hypothetical protein
VPPLAALPLPRTIDHMSETIATFMDSLTVEETQEFADELERRRTKIDALRASALARLRHLKEVQPQT